MNTKEQIEAGFKKALTERNEFELGVFRLLKAAIKNTEIAKGHELSEEETVAVLETQAKQRRDSIAQFEQANRNDLADKEKSELALIDSFLPAKMTEEEIRTFVKERIGSMPESDFGKVMGAIMADLKGKADGSAVQKVVKEEMGQ